MDASLAAKNVYGLALMARGREPKAYDRGKACNAMGRRVPAEEFWV